MTSTQAAAFIPRFDPAIVRTLHLRLAQRYLDRGVPGIVEWTNSDDLAYLVRCLRKMCRKILEHPATDHRIEQPRPVSRFENVLDVSTFRRIADHLTVLGDELSSHECLEHLARHLPAIPKAVVARRLERVDRHGPLSLGINDDDVRV